MFMWSPSSSDEAKGIPMKNLSRSLTAGLHMLGMTGATIHAQVAVKSLLSGTVAPVARTDGGLKSLSLSGTTDAAGKLTATKVAFVRK
jgi:hypothetical protein